VYVPAIRSGPVLDVRIVDRAGNDDAVVAAGSDEARHRGRISTITIPGLPNVRPLHLNRFAVDVTDSEPTSCGSVVEYHLNRRGGRVPEQPIDANRTTIEALPASE